MKKLTLIGAALGLALSAGVADAGFITGSLSFSGGFDTLPSAPTTSIVSNSTAFDITGTGSSVSTPNGAFTGTSSVVAFDFDINGLPSKWYVTDTGFTIWLQTASVGSSSALACGTGATASDCTDTITILVTGVVTSANFDNTAFVGFWTGNGSCQGAVNTCTSDISASWSASVVATGTQGTIPEPGTLALMGLGLAGVGGYRRRHAKKA